MLLLFEGFVLATLPVIAVIALLALAAWRDRRRAEAHARQIAVTEAIHRRLGAVVAPTVDKRAWGPWRLLIPVPFERPEVVASVIDIAHATTRAFAGARAGGRGGRAEAVEIVLTPQDGGRRACA